MCRDGAACARSICFFAHRESELRTPTPEELGPLELRRQAAAADASAAKAAAATAGAVAAQQAAVLQAAAAAAAVDQAADARERVWQHLLSLQAQQERADALRAVHDAAAQLGYAMMAAGMAPPAGPPVLPLDAPLLAATAAAPQLPGDAVCDGPARGLLAPGARAPGPQPAGSDLAYAMALQELVQQQEAAASLHAAPLGATSLGLPALSAAFSGDVLGSAPFGAVGGHLLPDAAFPGLPGALGSLPGGCGAASRPLLAPAAAWPQPPGGCGGTLGAAAVLGFAPGATDGFVVQW